MKHIQKEWYTCDRCGEKIENIPSAVTGICGRLHIKKNFNPSELRTLTAGKSGYITKENLISPDVVSVEIQEYYEGKINEIHLCGKCRKAFEQFMEMK